MGSGGTTSNPTIPDEFRPFVTGTMGQWMGQQALNPISGYNGNNAMDVEGMTPFQQLAMGYSAGNLQNSPQDLLAMQAAQRAAGMAGSGPTTGQYNPSGEMGLQDWAQMMDPYVGRGAEVGATVAPGDFLNDAQGANANPLGPAPPNFGGGPPPMGGGGPGTGQGQFPIPGVGLPGQGGGPGGGAGPGSGGGGFGPGNRVPGQASNAGLMPAGYQPRNTMSDEDFQSALSQYGISQHLLSQQHGAARANMLDELGIPAQQLQLINSHISQDQNNARRGTPDPNAHGVRNYVSNNPNAASNGGGGGGIQTDTPGINSRDNIEQAANRNTRTRTQTR